MPKKLPAISGQKLVSLLKALGYQVVRQRGSHVRLEKNTPAGTHKITIPNHNPVAKGTFLSRFRYGTRLQKRSWSINFKLLMDCRFCGLARLQKAAMKTQNSK